MKTNLSYRLQSLTLIPLCIAINLGIGTIVKTLSFPLYLDSIGTIIAAIVLGWRSGVAVGVIGFILMTTLGLNPFAIYFVGTQLVIAVTTHVLARTAMFKNWYKVISSGVILGIIAAIVSAPVIVLVFQGATGNGAALITGFFSKMGNQILESVVFSGFSIEPVDKIIQCLLAFYILKGIPTTFLSKYENISLERNNLI